VSRSRRLGLALAAAALTAAPTIVSAQDQCRTIRAMTNADGRKFADLSFGVARDPYRMTVRAGRGEALPTPENCDLSADADDVDMACHWRPGDYAATTALYDSLLARFQRCLGGRLAAPSGPSDYGGATALRRSSTVLDMDRGETTIDLSLIEAAQTAEIPAYHYISLSVSHQPRDPESEGEARED